MVVLQCSFSSSDIDKYHWNCYFKSQVDSSNWIFALLPSSKVIKTLHTAHIVTISGRFRWTGWRCSFPSWLLPPSGVSSLSTEKPRHSSRKSMRLRNSFKKWNSWIVYNLMNTTRDCQSWKTKQHQLAVSIMLTWLIHVLFLFLIFWQSVLKPLNTDRQVNNPLDSL